MTAHATTIRRPAAGLRSPAATGRNGLLIRSISTSSSWLIPTMKMFTHQAATSVQKRSKSSAPSGSPGNAVVAIAKSARTLSVVPTIVCGRLKRHSSAGALRPLAAPSGASAPASASPARLMATDANDPCGSMRATMSARYRATGADPPWGDPRGYHGVGMEGYFWRITEPRRGVVVVVLVAVNRDAGGRDMGDARDGRAPRRPRPRGDGRPRDGRAPPASACGSTATTAAPCSRRATSACGSTSAPTRASTSRSPTGPRGPSASCSAGSGRRRRSRASASTGTRTCSARASGAAGWPGRTRSPSTARPPTPRRTGARAGIRRSGGGARRTASPSGRTRAWRSPAAGRASARWPCPARPRSSSRSAARSSASSRRPSRCASRSAAGGWRLRARGARYRVDIEGHAGGTEPHLLPVPVAVRAPAPGGAVGDAPRGHAARPAARAGARLVFAGTSRLAGLERGLGPLSPAPGPREP